MHNNISKILLTGGAGFIGSNLCNLLLKKYDVTVYDNFSTGTFENIKHFTNKNNFCYVNGDILDNKKLKNYISQTDIVIHLAAAVGVKNIVNHPLNSLQTNLNGTKYVVDLVSEYNKKLIFASTSEIYGKQSKVPLTEQDGSIIGNVQKLRWSYATAKLIDEFYVLSYVQERKMDAIILRFFNTVGMNQSDKYGMVVPTFIKRAINNQNLKIHGSGNQKRNFTSIDEVVKCIFKLISNEKAYGEIFNIGGPEEVSILDLANKIIKATNSKSQLEFIPYDKVYNKNFDDMERRYPSTEKLFEFIGVRPIKGIDEIITDILKKTYE